MQTNYYFLRQLSKCLEGSLKGLVLAECFSQEKDELVLGFCTDGKQWRRRREFYIKAVLRPDFVCLNFPEEFRRASKNSIDLFSQLVGLHVICVRQFLNERAFAIEFEQGFCLLFKLFGNRSNLLLIEDTNVKALFHTRLVSDCSLSIRQLDRVIDQSYEAFEQANYDYRKLFPTFGKYIQIDSLPNHPQELWQRIQQFREQLENPTYYLCSINHTPILTLIPVGVIQKTFTGPIEASNEFYYAYTKVSVVEREKRQVINNFQKQITKTTAYIDHQYQKLAILDSNIKHEEIGHIIMAHLHKIEENTEVANLYDFYRDKPIRIKLKADLSPQKNAEYYYRKAKNEKIEVDKIIENITHKEQDLIGLQKHLQAITVIENLKALRKYLKDNSLDNHNKNTQPEAHLFKKFECMGYEIWVGRNAKNNDLLTQRYARKEDLWLHARDVAGSHVVVRYQAGKKFPNPVIERAAQLAAYYSKRRNDSLCPVIVAPRKYVRKTRDLNEGQVIVEKEQVVMVVPSP